MGLAGCIERRLFIRVEPSDARIFLDGRELLNDEGGSIEAFNFHGERRLTVRRLGYQTEERLLDISTPWYSQFPIDFVTEFLIPWTVYDEREFTIKLEPVPALSKQESDALIERAGAMAQEAGAEFR